MIKYTQGTIEDALAAETLITEFEIKKTVEMYQKKLDGHDPLILIARDNGKPVGFKVGYALSDTEYYNWLAGVAPEYRGKGIAGKLRRMQEEWTQKQGYTTMRVKSKNCFPNMLQMLIGSGYHICGYEDLGDTLNSKIHFVKQLPSV